jgi:hypothetical protein
MAVPELLVFVPGGGVESKMLVLSADASFSSQTSMLSLNVEHLEIKESVDDESLDMTEEPDFEAEDEDDEVERNEASSENSSRQANVEDDGAVAPASFALVAASDDMEIEG